MESSLWEAAVKGDTEVLLDVNNLSNSVFLTKTVEQDTILHIAAKHGRLKFIHEVLLRLPLLVIEKNVDGNTPLHIAANQGNSDIVRLLISHSQKHSSSNANPQEDTGLLAKNKSGDTAFHVALGRRNIEAATVFCQECTEDELEQLFDVRNQDDQTCLHLLAHHCSVDDILDDWDDIAALYSGIFIYADSLRVAQDKDGNTPLHLAIKSRNYCAAKLLTRRCLDSEEVLEFSIHNNEGHSVFDLLAPQVVMTDTYNFWRHELSVKNKQVDPVSELLAIQLYNLHEPQIKDLKEMMSRAKRLAKERGLVKKKMDDELYKAAIAADLKVFHGVKTQGSDVEHGSINLDDAYFLSQTPDGSNIVHIALQQGKEEGVHFIEEALNQYPSLLFQVHTNGDTPLHLAAKLLSPVSKKLATCFGQIYSRVMEQHQRGVLLLPLQTKNHQGNMPIHEALRTNNVFVARALLHIDPDQGAYHVNDLGETPLHIYARFGFTSVKEKDEVLESLITKNASAMYTRDGDELTPLLRAAKCGRFRIAKEILKHCPQSAYIRDPKGRTFLHLLQFTGGDIGENSADHLFKWLGEELFKIPEADALRVIQDSEGNTPLHHAIKTENSIAAEILTRRCLETKYQSELMLANNQDETVLHLLASHDLPNEITELIRKKHPSLVYSIGSSYGVRKSDVKDSASALSVVAGLLLTVTFAAAFQVPGGFDGDGGFPLLIKKAAFKVFLVSDAFAVCSSTVVLFSLLWVMGSGKAFSSFVLIDISFFLLQASFYATLLTFMTGVYVATSSKTHWLAIFVCALCSTVVLITWKRSILFLSRHVRLVIDMLITVKGLSFRGYIKHHRSLSGTH